MVFFASIAIGLVAGSIFGAIWWGHRSLVVSCADKLVVYNNRIDSFQNWADSNSDVANVTRDEVMSDDVEAVNNFRSIYAKAKSIARDEKVADSQCNSERRNADLHATVNEIDQKSDQLAEYLTQLKSSTSVIATAMHNKELSDAKSALESTLLSAKTLSNNQSINSSTRSQLIRAVAVAQSVMQSDDLSNIVSVRKQMDDIVSQLNESISNTNIELAQLEEKVKSVKSTPDKNGSYITSAQNILASANLSPVWGLSNMSGACSITPQQAASWIAAFCTATPHQVYINNGLGLDTTNDIYFADAMRHEIGHYMIYRRCGSVEPASIGVGANAESTASSYAVLYLGANANTLNRAGDSRYHMNQASDNAAARIHAGQCR